ncbi:distal tail protein Dit [Clostridium perfringens]|uniref:distal tail protein Dit n=1 Tax=Clostridium perfringens TaxID=1502 RepID=UPI0032DA1C45
METILDLLLDNKWLKKDFGVSIVKRSPSLYAPKNINIITRQGGDGDLYVDLGGRSDIVIPVECNFISNNPKDVFRRVKAWLNNVKDNKLIFTDDPYWFYRVVKIDISTMDIYLKRKGQFTINFTCRGWHYLLDGDEFLELDSNTLLANEYDVAKPLIYIEGNGEIIVNINNNIFKVFVKDYIYIDSELEVAYRTKEDYINIDEGDYPLLEYGDNNITYNGNINKFEIKPRWREV